MGTLRTTIAKEVARSANPAQSEKQRASLVSPRHRIKVSMVESDAAVRESLAQILAVSDDFICASTHDTAHAAFAELPHIRPALLLLGEPPSGISLGECLSWLKSKLAGTKTILISNRCDAQILIEAFQAGVQGYLVKPFAADEVPHAIRFALAGGRPISHAAAVTFSDFLVEQIKSHTCHPALTAREHEVMRCLEKGLQYKEIAEALAISTFTVTQHLHHIYEKLGVHNKVEALNKFHGK